MKAKSTVKNKAFRPISSVERPHLLRVCAELGINPAAYQSDDEALCQAITAGILAEVAAKDHPDAGSYQI